MCFVFQNFGCHCSCLLSCRVPHFAAPAGRRFDAFTFIYGTICNLACRAHLDFARCLVLVGNHRRVDAWDSFGGVANGHWSATVWILSRLYLFECGDCHRMDTAVLSATGHADRLNVRSECKAHGCRGTGRCSMRQYEKEKRDNITASVRDILECHRC